MYNVGKNIFETKTYLKNSSLNIIKREASRKIKQKAHTFNSKLQLYNLYTVCEPDISIASIWYIVVNKITLCLCTNQ